MTNKTPEQIYNDGIDAMVHSFMTLIEACVRQRCEQIMKIIKEGIESGE